MKGLESGIAEICSETDVGYIVANTDGCISLTLQNANVNIS